MDVEVAARALLDAVLENDLPKVQELVSHDDNHSSRTIARYEFSLPEYTSPSGPAAMRDDPRCPKLIDYEILSMSPLHGAALFGHMDIVIELLDKDIPVDAALASGTTLLHLAAFGGTDELVSALLHVYKADRFRRDRYGWTALHYASTEGKMDTVQVLVAAGLDVTARDQDGTTAAFRADINGHKDVVTLLCQYGGEDDMLNVTDSFSVDDSEQVAYSKVKKVKPPSDRRLSAPPVDLSSFGEDGRVPSLVQNGKPNLPPRNRSQSVTSAEEKNKSVPGHSQTLPTRSSKKIGRNTVRRILRKELEHALGGDYMEPRELNASLGMKGREVDDSNATEVDNSIGLHTLKGIMREELDRYRREALGPGRSSAPAELPPDLEDTYASLSSLPLAPLLPSEAAPPLPPRNPTMAVHSKMADDVDSVLGTVKLKKFDPGDSALRECFARLAPQLGDNWKRLARALPLASDNALLEKRIQDLDESYPEALDRQALAALVEWRINNGKDAGLDELILGLRKASLLDLIPVVDRISQEFTA